MNLLLDTHIFIWWDSEPGRLPPNTRALLLDPTVTLLLSIASMWEMQIKVQLRKLHLRLPLADLIAEQQRVNGLRLVPVEPQHVFAVDGLAPHHRDPFDRMLIVQAQTEGYTLITADAALAPYGVPLAT